jgi:hypothetical protein
MRVNATHAGERLSFRLDRLLRAIAASHHDAGADGALGVPAFAIVQVSIEERVLVIPVDLQSRYSVRECFNVIDHTDRRNARYAVDRARDLDAVRSPTDL